MLKRIYIAVIIILAAITVFYKSVDVTPLLPDDNTEFAKAEVVDVTYEDLLADGTNSGSQGVILRITSGNYKNTVIEGISLNGYLYGAYCTPGEKVIVRLSEYDGRLSASVYNYDRELQIAVLVILFLGCMWLVGGKRGIHSMVALVFTFAIIIMLYIPMIYIGISPFVSAVLSVALITMVSIILIGGISISSLGAVMDVAMSVSSSLTEIHDKSPELPARELFYSGIRIGRDMIGTMSNTLILAYVGSSVNMLLIIYSYSYSMHQVLNMYSIGIEIMQGLSGTMGIILTVPFVSLISAVFLSNKNKFRDIKGKM